MKQTPRILSVGQCGFDHGSIGHALRRDFEASVQAADTHADALAALRRDGPFDLVLVNRVGDADGAPGLDLIAALKSDPATRDVPTMLVSNYADAQERAEALGALPGFGKADLGKPRFRERVGTALASSP